MKIKLSKITILWTVVSMSMLAGCVKENPDSSAHEDGKARISFATPVITEQTTAQTQQAPKSITKVDQNQTTRAVLEQHTTVRVVVYLAGGMAYKAEQTYFIDTDGKLKPCTVNLDGSFKDIDNQNELALIPDKYDFYAITPALPLNADNTSVNVPNGIDFASSVTSDVEVKTDRTLTLTELSRRCAKIALVVEKASDNNEMTNLSVIGKGVTISMLPSTAANIRLNTDISAASGVAELNVTADKFEADAGSTTTSKTITYLLPRLSTERMKLTYDLQYTVSGSPESKTVSGTMGNIVLEKCKSYTFTLTMRKTGATIAVKEWIDGGSQEVGMTPVDYTDNGMGWFQINASNAYSPLDLSKTKINWYIATGTFDVDLNPGTLSACPAGWRLPSKDEMHMMWIYKYGFPEVARTKGIYWASTPSISEMNMSWFNNQDTGTSFGAGKSDLYNVRCVRDAVTTAKNYPYVDFNTNGQKCVIVSRDYQGGVAQGGVLGETEMAYLNSRQPTTNELSQYNKVAPRLEVAQTNAGVNITWTDWMKLGIGNDGSGCPSGWRMPTQREMTLIMVMALNGKLNVIEPLVASGNQYYITSNESSRTPSNIWTLSSGLAHSADNSLKSSLFSFARCVRDINVEQPKPILIGQFGGWNGTEYTKQLQVDWSNGTIDDANKKFWSKSTIITGATNAHYGVADVNIFKSLSPDLSEYPAAKYCADKGNGWYLPSQNQLMALWIMNKGIPSGFLLNSTPTSSIYWSATENGMEFGWYVSFTEGYTNGTNKPQSLLIRCVRDVESTVKTSPKVVVEGGRFIVDSRDMPLGAITNTKKAINTNVADNITLGSTDPVLNIGSTKSNEQIYSYFEIAKSDLKSSDWLGAVQGCANIADDGKGKWRLPTQREMILVWIYKKNLESNIGFDSLGEKNYWTATERNNTDSWYLNLKHGLVYTKTKTEPYFVRCIRDL